MKVLYVLLGLLYAVNTQQTKQCDTPSALTDEVTLALKFSWVRFPKGDVNIIKDYLLLYTITETRSSQTAFTIWDLTSGIETPAVVQRIVDDSVTVTPSSVG
jgi:hypothetical protein